MNYAAGDPKTLRMFPYEVAYVKALSTKDSNYANYSRSYSPSNATYITATIHAVYQLYREKDGQTDGRTDCLR